MQPGSCGGRDRVLRGTIFISSHPIFPPCSPSWNAHADSALPRSETIVTGSKCLGSLSNASPGGWGKILLPMGLRLV